MAFVVGCTIVTQVDDLAAGILLLGACVVFAVAFVIIDRRAAAPLLPRQLTGDRRTLHRSPVQAAVTLLPFSLAVIAGSSLSVSLQRRVRPQSAVSAAGATRFALPPGRKSRRRPGLRQSAPAGGAPRPSRRRYRAGGRDAGGVKDRARLRLRAGREVLAGWPGAPTATASRKVARPCSVAALGRAEQAVTASPSLGLAAGPVRVPRTEDPG